MVKAKKVSLDILKGLVFFIGGGNSILMSYPCGLRKSDCISRYNHPFSPFSLLQSREAKREPNSSPLPLAGAGPAGADLHVLTLMHMHQGRNFFSLYLCQKSAYASPYTMKNAPR